MMAASWGYDTVVTIGNQHFNGYHSGGADLLVELRDTEGQVFRSLPEPWATVAQESTPVGFALVRGTVIYPVTVEFAHGKGWPF